MHVDGLQTVLRTRSRNGDDLSIYPEHDNPKVLRHHHKLIIARISRSDQTRILPHIVKLLEFSRDGHR